MTARRAAVWLDQSEARICRLDPHELASASAPRLNSRQKQAAEWQSEHSSQRRFFDDIAALLKDTDQLLILGPSATKLDFVSYLQRHNSMLESKIVAVETLAQASDSQLLAHVRHYFRSASNAGGTTP